MFLDHIFHHDIHFLQLLFCVFRDYDNNKKKTKKQLLYPVISDMALGGVWMVWRSLHFLTVDPTMHTGMSKLVDVIFTPFLS